MFRLYFQNHCVAKSANKSELIEAINLAILQHRLHGKNELIDHDVLDHFAEKNLSKPAHEHIHPMPEHYSLSMDNPELFDWKIKDGRGVICFSHRGPNTTNEL